VEGRLVNKRFDQKVPVTEVTWNDCLLFTGGWEAHDAVMRQRRRIRQRSVGYVLEDDKRGIVLAAALSQGGNVFGAHVIPRAQIVRVRRLR
jgi:hypothetical protein